MRRLFPFLFLFLHGALNCGLPAGTLIQTPSGYTPIEDGAIGTVLCCQSGQQTEVVSTHSRVVKDALRLVLGGATVVASPDQKFYMPLKREWRAAKDIKRGDALSDAAEEYVVVLDVVPTNDALCVFELSLQEPHTFYVTKQNILAHNCAPILLGIAETAPVAATAAKVGLAGLVSWFAKQVQKSNGRRSLGGSGAPQPRPPEDPEDDDDENSEEWKKKHPNGKHQGASYHHQNSDGVWKNKAPKDGQKALDTSMPYKNLRGHRISYCDGEFVVLHKICEGKFQGHVRTWEELSKPMRDALVSNEIANLRGKIL